MGKDIKILSIEKLDKKKDCKWKVKYPHTKTILAKAHIKSLEMVL